jgi:hypothetical protein
MSRVLLASVAVIGILVGTFHSDSKSLHNDVWQLPEI